MINIVKSLMPFYPAKPQDNLVLSLKNQGFSFHSPKQLEGTFYSYSSVCPGNLEMELVNTGMKWAMNIKIVWLLASEPCISSTSLFRTFHSIILELIAN